MSYEWSYSKQLIGLTYSLVPFCLYLTQVLSWTCERVSAPGRCRFHISSWWRKSTEKRRVQMAWGVGVCLFAKKTLILLLEKCIKDWIYFLTDASACTRQRCGSRNVTEMWSTFPLSLSIPAWTGEDKMGLRLANNTKPISTTACPVKLLHSTAWTVLQANWAQGSGRKKGGRLCVDFSDARCSNTVRVGFLCMEHMWMEQISVQLVHVLTGESHCMKEISLMVILLFVMCSSVAVTFFL